MDDFAFFLDVAVKGVKLIPLIVGLMEMAKRHFGVTGRALVLSAICVLFAFGVMAGMMAEGLMPETALPRIRVCVWPLGFVLAGLAAMGLHDWAKRFRPPAPDPE